MNDLSQEIKTILQKEQDSSFESLTPTSGSPLNQPVVEKGPEVSKLEEQAETQGTEFEFPDEGSDEAPEQEIAGPTVGTSDPELEEPPPRIPLAAAQLAASSLIGMADNVLVVGGGFFVKIKKHRGFYDFEEVIQVIEEQNERNLQRIRLSEEDKALLLPLLAVIIQKRATKLTPEQQLMGAILSILIKKGQAVLEIRAENQILTERMLSIIQEKKTTAGNESQDEEEQESIPEPIETEIVQTEEI